MNSSDFTSKPRYSFVALRPRWARLLDTRRLILHDQGIFIYKFLPWFRHESEYMLFSASWILWGDKVSSVSTLSGLQRSNMAAQIRMSILKHHSKPKERNEHFWKVENFLFSGLQMSEVEFKSTYSWLREKVWAKGVDFWLNTLSTTLTCRFEARNYFDLL